MSRESDDSSAPDRIHVSTAIVLKRIEEVSLLFPEGTNLSLPTEHLTYGQLATRIATYVESEKTAGLPVDVIFFQGIGDVVQHADAMDLLKGQKTAVVHARQIEEIVATLFYVGLDPNRFEELAWRWRSYQMVHGARNRILHRGGEPLPALEGWISKNIQHLQKYVSNKFTGDWTRDRERWLKYNTWLYPKMIKDVFTEAGRLPSYEAAGYAWNSHGVHFSPLGEHFFSLQTDHASNQDHIAMTTRFHMMDILRAARHVLRDPEKARLTRARFILSDLYADLNARPEWTIQMVERSDQLKQVIAELVRSDFSIDRLLIAVLGRAPVPKQV